MSDSGELFRVGLVGAGMAASHHLMGWQAQPDAQVVAIADPDFQRACALAAGNGDAKAYSDLDAMLAEQPLDAIDIVAPVAVHAPLIEKGAARGIPVMCQKPLTLTLVEGEALLARLSAGARVMVHENWRWRSPYRRLKALLDDRSVARPKGFEFQVTSSGLLANDDGIAPALRRQPFLAHLKRFIVMEVLIHHLDVLRFLFGPVVIKRASLARQSGLTRGEDTARIELEAGGISGTLFGSFVQPDAPPLPTDRMVLDNGNGLVIEGWSITSPRGLAEQWDPAAAYQASYTATIRHFVAATRSVRPYETGLIEAIDALRLVEAVYAAAGADAI